MPITLRRCSSRAPTSAIETLCPWAIRSFRLLITRRLSFSEKESGTESSSCKTPTTIGFRVPGLGFRANAQQLFLPEPETRDPEPDASQRPLVRLLHIPLEPVADL